MNQHIPHDGPSETSRRLDDALRLADRDETFRSPVPLHRLVCLTDSLLEMHTAHESWLSEEERQWCLGARSMALEALQDLAAGGRYSEL